MNNPKGDRRRPGRPKENDGDQISAYVSQRVAQGMAVLDACKGGLVIYSLVLGKHGEPVRRQRLITAQTLERRYRQHSSARRAELKPADTEMFRFGEIRPVGGLRLPPMPLSFDVGRELKRGRPQLKSKPRK